MAKVTKSAVSVKCDVCGKVVEARPGGAIPVDYVWRDGYNICHDCMTHGKTPADAHKEGAS